MIQVMVDIPGESAKWAHLPEVPRQDDIVALRNDDGEPVRYRVGLVHWDLHRDSQGVPDVPDGRISLTIATLVLVAL